MDDMSRNHVEEIYPGLNPVLMEVLVEEAAAIGFVTIRDSEVSATGPGEAKRREFTSSLTKKKGRPSNSREGAVLLYEVTD